MVACSASTAPRRRRIGAAVLAVAVTAALMMLLVAAAAVDAAAAAKNKQLPRSSRRGGGGGGASSSPVFTKLTSSSSSSNSAAAKRDENVEGSMPRTVAIYSTGFATPEVDGHWGDWARKVDRPPAETKLQIAPLVDPPSRLAAAYRPLSGPYSSRDPAAVRAHLEALAAAGVGGVLTYCSAPTVAAVEPTRAAVEKGLAHAAATTSSSTSTSSSSSRSTASGTGAVGRQLLQQQQQQQAKTTTAAASASSSSSSTSSSSVRIIPAERPTNASALGVLVAQAAVLGLGVGFVVPEYRHRNARTVRDDLRWCLSVAEGAVRNSAAARGALAARPPAAQRAQPLAPLLSHGGKAVFLVKAAASIPCHHWTALLKSGGAFSVREAAAARSGNGGSGSSSGIAKKVEAVAEGLRKKRAAGEEKGGVAGAAAAAAATAVAGAGAVSGLRSLLVASSSSSLSSSTATAAAAGKTTVRSAFSSSASASSASSASSSKPSSSFSASSSSSSSSASSSSSSSSSSPSPQVSLDGFWFAEWRDRDDGDVAASCGFDGVATAPGDDGSDATADASAAENDKVEPAPFGAEPGNWPAMRARARRQGLAFLATVSPGSDATPVRPWSASKVRAREPGGARYSRLWRYAALSGPDGVVVDSFNGWNEGTQIEPAAEAAGCGGGGVGGGGENKDEGDEAASSSSSSLSSAATALGPQCAPDVRSYSEGEDWARGLSSSSSFSGSSSSSKKSRQQQEQQQQRRKKAAPQLYMRLTASEAARAAAVASRVSGRGYELPRALPSQLEARGRRGGGGHSSE